MQQAIAYSRSAATGKVEVDEDRIAKAVAENPVVVVGRRGCCMVHVMRRLLQGQGVNPAVCDVGGGDGDGDEAAAIGGISGGWVGEVPEVQLPAVFIGGRLVGGIDRLMAVHISGELVPILKDAGALWL
ncbi:Monothiol glutaredoxin-S5 [Apostasia shenzhenica]|uniref:Monothiol glutaredoxin-S5 n=1 Tax=Apostasia shenzhenica TaxID=1088818 RepID=A0A2I0AU91_9ASPA|nr:Monothiol glutaredoxin-S5 [Apostasia shenzhenica]